ncbi:hypothetical protein ACFUC1_01050 [Pedococcus sp. NPDC057267]|uniref:hypothetical protein n=1 Tax=Pedococcus sp. NPDC057267 TaxID=3346077 RepID=UPI003633BD99
MPAAARSTGLDLRSPQGVVVHLLRHVMDPSWAPGPAAAVLLRDVDDDRLLRRARALLRIATRERIVPSHVRAFATVTMALHLLEDRA